MQITMRSSSILEIKSKNTAVLLDKEIKIGEVVLSGPGEYDVAGIAVVGYAGEEHPFYLIEIEEMNLIFFPEKLQKLSDQNKENLGSIDIAIVPVNGGTTVADTMALINSLEPNIVIPTGDQSGVEEFSKQAGSVVEKLDILKITKAMLLPDERRIVALKA